PARRDAGPRAAGRAAAGRAPGPGGGDRRRFRPADVPEFVAYRSRAEVARFQSWDAPYPREEGERFVRQLMKEHPDTPGEWFQFAVALRPAGRLIGDCAAMPHA